MGLSVSDAKTAAAPYISALDLCGCPQRALLATRQEHTGVCKSRNSSDDALFMYKGLVALMQPIICCVRARSQHASL